MADIIKNKVVRANQTWKIGYGILEMAEFAPGVISAHDSVGEFDIYFNEDWKPKHEKLFNYHPPVLGGTNLGVFTDPLAKDFGRALHSAKELLIPASSKNLKWYDTPLALDDFKLLAYDKKTGTSVGIGTGFHPC